MARCVVSARKEVCLPQSSFNVNDGKYIWESNYDKQRAVIFANKVFECGVPQRLCIDFRFIHLIKEAPVQLAARSYIQYFSLKSIALSYRSTRNQFQQNVTASVCIHSVAAFIWRVERKCAQWNTVYLSTVPIQCLKQSKKKFKCNHPVIANSKSAKPPYWVTTGPTATTANWSENLVCSKDEAFIFKQILSCNEWQLFLLVCRGPNFIEDTPSQNSKIRNVGNQAFVILDIVIIAAFRMGLYDQFLIHHLRSCFSYSACTTCACCWSGLEKNPNVAMETDSSLWCGHGQTDRQTDFVLHQD